MAYRCTQCGKTHEEMPQYFMWKKPDCVPGSAHEFIEDSKSLARLGDSRFFVMCEVEMCVASDPNRKLGFMCWVEVEISVYESLLAFRRNEAELPAPTDLIEGRLANPVPCVAETLGLPVRFAVMKGDPTPYIKWVASGTALDDLLQTGASMEYWHEAAERMGWRADR